MSGPQRSCIYAVVHCDSTVIGSFVTGPHTEMGSSCQYRVPGVNSDTQMDVFRILRVAFLKSTSAGAGAAPSDTVDCLPLSYEIFAPEQVRHGASARPSIREPADKTRDVFAKVTTYLRNSGNTIVRTHATKKSYSQQMSCESSGVTRWAGADRPG